MDNVKKFYLASVESADFKNAAEESRKMINSWVESQTNGRLWESHSLKVTAESPLCVNTVLDPDGAARSQVRRDWRRWGGLQGVDGPRQWGEKRAGQGRQGSQHQPPAGTAESWQWLCGSQVSAQTLG